MDDEQAALCKVVTRAQQYAWRQSTTRVRTAREVACEVEGRGS